MSLYGLLVALNQIMLISLITPYKFVQCTGGREVRPPRNWRYSEYGVTIRHLIQWAKNKYVLVIFISLSEIRTANFSANQNWIRTIFGIGCSNLSDQYLQHRLKKGKRYIAEISMTKKVDFRRILRKCKRAKPVRT